ncbi:MAG TPA: NRDE family protein [Geobacteraceae bacterium]
MCLILIAHDCHPRYRLIVAANRDEYHARPTAKASFWADAPEVLAGRDLEGGGTWLGLTATGRFAALTNFREPHLHRKDAPSRGRLVSDFLCGNMDEDAFRQRLEREGETYNGFNLLFGAVDRLGIFSNRAQLPPELAPGIHGISNHLPDTPWPKVVRGKEGLTSLVSAGNPLTPRDLFALLADRTQPADAFLPNTGVGLELERQLAPLFIRGKEYGTRCSTVVLVDQENKVTFAERTFPPPHGRPSTVTFNFTLPA